MAKRTTGEASPQPGGRRYLLLFLLLLLAGALLAAGTILGENGLVERNAHYLCLDCLGIG